MGDVATGLLGKRVAVLSDHQALCRAIELSLKSLLRMEIVETSSRSSAQEGHGPESDDLDLMVVATSSPDSEPIVTLARASLLDRVGRTPLLMISDRPLHSEGDAGIFHLKFPFDSDQLCDKVREILSEAVRTDCGQRS